MYAPLVCQFGVFCRYPTPKTYRTLKGLSSLEWVSAGITQSSFCAVWHYPALSVLCDFVSCPVGDGYATSFENFVETQLKLHEVGNCVS